MKIAVVGGYGVGMTMRVARAAHAGETITGGELSIGPGGKGSNQAVAAARLGVDVSLHTAVGRDSAAADARDLWRRERVDATTVVVGERPTMTGFIVVDSEGENRITIAPGALTEMTAESLETCRDRFREADLVIVSLEIPIAAAEAALRIAHEVGTRTLLNPAPAAELPHRLWDWVDIVTPNHSEAIEMLGRGAPVDDPRSLARQLQERVGGVVVMTAGANGVFVHDGTDEFVVEPIRVAGVVDTTGAGDAFTAALGVALAEGRTLIDAVGFAAAAGAHAVTIADVIPSLPTRAELDDLLCAASDGKEPSHHA